MTITQIISDYMKKIAVISNTFPPFSGGGVATAQFNIFKKLQEKDFEVKGFTFYDHGKIKLEEESIIRCGSPKIIFRTINTITKNCFAKSSKKNCATSNEYAWQWNFTLNSAIGCWKINRELKRTGCMPPLSLLLKRNRKPFNDLKN